MKITAIKNKVLLLFSLMLIALLSFSCGDKPSAAKHTLVLKDGTILKGELVSRTDEGLKFEVDGQVREIAMAEVFSLTMREGEEPVYLASEEKTAAASQPAPSRTQAPASPPAKKQTSATPPPSTSAKMAESTKPATPPAPKSVTLPAGTKLLVRLTEAVSTQTHSAGTRFSSVLDIDLAADGVVVAPKGSKVYGTIVESIGGRRIGNQRLVAEFTEISIDDKLVPIKTEQVGAEGAEGGAIKTVGAGALIGAAAGDAGADAAIGAGLALLAGGNHINVPAGTLVEIDLTQPVTVTK